MEGQQHQKRAVRITKKGVAPSPHVLHLRRPPIEPPAVQKPILPPPSLAIEVAFENMRARIHKRVHDNTIHAVRQFVQNLRAIPFRRRSKAVLADIEARVEKTAPIVIAAIEHVVEERIPVRKRIATWLAGRVTTSHVHMPPRRLSIVFFVAMLVFMLLPVGVIKVYQDVRIQKAQLHEQKVLMVALTDTVRDAFTRGDFQAAGDALRTLEDALGLVERSMNAWGPLRYVPPFYQTRQGVESAREAVGQSVAVLSGVQQFPWKQDVFAAATNALDAADRAAHHVGQARIGVETTAIRGYIRLLKDAVTLAHVFLGGEEGRYLVVFQNENELRPTGGFMGSFAVLTLRDGGWSIEMPSQGSYALQGWQTKSVRAPKQLSLINPRFEFQDVNWFPDFPTTAEKIMDFYQAGGGSSVDGVIAVNSSLLDDVLTLTGPIEVPEINGAPLKNGTIVESLQKAIARDRATNAPKAVLGGLLNALATQFQSGAVKPLPFGQIVLSALPEKKIQMYFKDAQKQAAAHRLGFDGALPRIWDKDFFMMVSASVAGGKTDGAIHDAVDYRVAVEENGSLIARVSVTRTHQGLRGDALRGVRNTSYVRFYVPRGAEFLGATGFSPAPSWRFEDPAASLVPDQDIRSVELTERTDTKSGTIIAEEQGKTVFGNWVMIDPGQVKTIELTYRLPHRIARDTATHYALMAAKQSGRNMVFRFALYAPGLRVISLPDGEVRHEGYSEKTILATDQITRLELTP